MAVRDLTHPAHHDDDREAIRALAAGERNTYSAEKRYLRADGSEAWVALHVTVVRNADGGPQYFLSQMADIGERRAAEHALAESEERFRTLASASPVGVFADRRGRAAGLRQRPPARDLRHAGRGARRRALARARPGRGPRAPRRRVPPRAGARRAHVARRARRWPASTAGRASTWRPSPRAPDQPMGLVGTIEDVTVEVTARMALAAREAEYRMLAEHSTDFLSRHTIDGTFLYASPVSRAMLGWDSEAMLGRTPKHLEHGPPRRHGDHRAQLGRRAARGALAHGRLPRAAARRLDRVAGDDLPRRPRPRRRGARDGLRVARHLRAQERRARARPPRTARRAHRPAQPHAVPRPPRPGAAALAPARRAASPSSSSTSIASRSSTTRWATRPATACSSTWPCA